MNAMMNQQSIEAIQAEYEAACAAIPVFALSDYTSEAWDEFNAKRAELRRIRDEKLRELVEKTAQARKQVASATKKALTYLVYSCRV